MHRSAAPGDAVIPTLVVDDDFMTASLHAGFVARVSGFEVVGRAHTGSEAVRLAAELEPSLLLLDLCLPDMSGLDALRELRHVTRPSPDAIAITVARDSGTVRAALQAGVVGYLVKPVPFAVVRERLECYRALHTRLARSGEVDQDEVDRLWGMLRTPTPRTLPKGIASGTLRLVRHALESDSGALSVDEVARVAGVGASSARRYLEYLHGIGTVEVQPQFGRTGRPSHRYRLVHST